MMKGEKENMMRKQAEDGQIFSLRFMPCNVADCQRTPAFPQVGKPFRVSGFENPHY